MAGAGSAFVIEFSQMSQLGKRWHEIAANMRGDSARAKLSGLRAGDMIAGYIRDEIADLYNPDAVSVRTGNLGRTFRSVAHVTPDGLTFGAVSSEPYASVQDKGATIYPRRRKYLAIPLIRLPLGKGPRKFDDGELFRVGNTLARRIGNGRNAKLEFVFALAKSARIPGKNYLASAARKALPDVATLLVHDWTRGL